MVRLNNYGMSHNLDPRNPTRGQVRRPPPRQRPHQRPFDRTRMTEMDQLNELIFREYYRHHAQPQFYAFPPVRRHPPRSAYPPQPLPTDQHRIRTVPQAMEHLGSASSIEEAPQLTNRIEADEIVREIECELAQRWGSVERFVNIRCLNSPVMYERWMNRELRERQGGRSGAQQSQQPTGDPWSAPEQLPEVDEKAIEEAIKQAFDVFKTPLERS